MVLLKPDEDLLNCNGRCNDLVVSWLTDSLSKDLARSVESSEYAKDVWSELEERYGKADAARVFELKKDLAHIAQGAVDIASYFNKIKQHWDEIDALSITRVNSCTCGAKSEYQKDKICKISTVYSILLSDEKQRQVSIIPQFSSTSTSFNVGTSSGTPRQSFPSKVNFDNQKPGLFCKYCKRTNHTIEKCYRLHEYPFDFKFTKGSGNKNKNATHDTLEHPYPCSTSNLVSNPIVSQPQH
ncbi:uncharacterized protein LOC132048822 [Lycium ferocissimum]|uniref:uncharacterized protein LOC132048822 n=1 Tax=Lycium ferocissimum TaxID=112874 RepID=UPI0028154B38|nr:uncharacterized protein LOC132048822 [Lycium ferocissimum]